MGLKKSDRRKQPFDELRVPSKVEGELAPTGFDDP